MGIEKNNLNRIMNPEELMNVELLMQIPTDPQKEEIVEILSKNPAVISYIQNILVEIKNDISMKKILVKKKERELDSVQSQVRIETIRLYKHKLEEKISNEPIRLKELMIDFGMNKSEAKEIVKLERPDKPTATDLKDIAINKTANFYDEHILPLELEIQELEKSYNEWKVKYDLFENNFKASQSIKGLIQSDIKNHY